MHYIICHMSFLTRIEAIETILVSKIDKTVLVLERQTNTPTGL